MPDLDERIAELQQQGEEVVSQYARLIDSLYEEDGYGLLPYGVCRGVSEVGRRPMMVFDRRTHVVQATSHSYREMLDYADALNAWARLRPDPPMGVDA